MHDYHSGDSLIEEAAGQTHNLGKYVISDKPMTEEQWALERADVIDVTPSQKDDKA